MSVYQSRAVRRAWVRQGLRPESASSLLTASINWIPTAAWRTPSQASRAALPNKGISQLPGPLGEMAPAAKPIKSQLFPRPNTSRLDKHRLPWRQSWPNKYLIEVAAVADFRSQILPVPKVVCHRSSSLLLKLDKPWPSPNLPRGDKINADQI